MHNEEIEKAVLFHIIFSDEQCDLSEKDFTNHLHKKIIKAINELKSKKEIISIMTIADLIGDNKADMLTYLSDLGQYVFNTDFDTAYYMLKKYTKKREVYELAKEIMIDVGNEDDIDVFIEKNINQMEKIVLQTEKDLTFSEQINETLKKIETRVASKDKDKSLFTGIFELDRLTDGLHGSELTVIGARPRSW